MVWRSLVSLTQLGSIASRLKTKILFLELLWLNVKEIDVNVDDLQVTVIDSLVCTPKGFRIYSQLLNLSSTCKPNAQGIVPFYLNKSSLKTQDILENCSDLLVSSFQIYSFLLWFLSLLYVSLCYIEFCVNFFVQFFTFA